MTVIKIPAFLVGIMLSLAHGARAEEEIDLWRGRYRISAETVGLPGDERMGMAGANYLIDVASWFSAGVGAYGAMTGQRGGFLVGGIAAGIDYPLFSDIFLDAGAFIGGGGGQAALVGGGLMVRSHAGLLYDSRNFRVGLHYVILDFPNGTIRSDHAALTLDIPFTSLKLRSGPSKRPAEIPDEVIRTTGQEPVIVSDFLGPLYAVYHPFSGVKNTDGVTPTERFSLIGFEYGRYLTNESYVFMETAGAMGGNADGYAEFFFGGGYRLPLFSVADRPGAGNLVLDSRLSVGSGGGGRVDTDGGALAKAVIGLQYDLTEQAHVVLYGGVVDAFRGAYRAKMLGVSVSYSLDFLSLDGTKLERRPAEEEMDILDWRVRLSNQVYRTKDERMRNPSDERVLLLGVKADADIAPHIYLSGQALGAYDGGAGGYAVGLLGPGLRSGPLFGSDARIFVEALVGASGGGGIDVGGGAIIQPAAGIVYDIGDRLGIEASCGKVKAIHGQLDTTVYDVGLVYRFSTMNR